MPRTTLTRKVQAPQAQVLNLLLDFERYPAFVPGVLRVRAKPVASAEQKEAVEVEALLKNSKFSGTVRVHVQADRPVGRVLVSHRFGPFKTLSINFKVNSVSPQSAEIRCDMEVASTVAAINTIVSTYLVEAANAYADVFERELTRLAETNLSRT